MKNFIKKYWYKAFAPGLGKQEAILSEIQWAHIYHDTIRDKKWMKNLSLSPNDMSANYSMLYVMTRILSEFRIASVLELGLGESSKMINSWVDRQQEHTRHDIVENNEEWISFFEWKISQKSTIIHCQLSTTQIDQLSVRIYDQLMTSIQTSYDFYIIDGPRGQNRFSRYDICFIAENFNERDEFIILFDDTQRKGEQETIVHLQNLLDRKKITYFTKEFHGIKSQTVIMTEKYKFIKSF